MTNEERAREWLRRSGLAVIVAEAADDSEEREEYVGMLAELLDAVQAEEREACAQICESEGRYWQSVRDDGVIASRYCAQRIRARGGER